MSSMQQLTGYEWHTDRQMRNSYRLPHRVAEQITSF